MILIKSTLEEGDTLIQGIITASGPIKAARIKWLNDIVEKSLAELSAKKGNQTRFYREIQTIIEES